MAQHVHPYLLYEDGEAAIEFVTNAFGFGEVDRQIGGAGGLPAELEVEPGGGCVYLASRRAASGIRPRSAEHRSCTFS